MKNNLLLQAAITGLLFSAGCNTTQAASKVSADKPESMEMKGECHGINSCKGTGECGGKGHSCAGKNSCKGEGWVSKTKAECDEAGGKFKSQKHM